LLAFWRNFTLQLEARLQCSFASITCADVEMQAISAKDAGVRSGAKYVGWWLGSLTIYDFSASRVTGRVSVLAHLYASTDSS
jgi:hypothetical protein